MLIHRTLLYKTIMGLVDKILKETEDASSEFDNLEKEWKERGCRVFFSVSSKTNSVSLDIIKVPENLRGQGYAKQIMTDFVNLCDKNNLVASLHPVKDFGANMKRLMAFYKSFGFVPNSGKNKIYDIWNSLIRLPKQ